MKLFRIVATQLVYHETVIEAESADDAAEFLREDGDWLDWNEFQYGDWEILDINEVKP